MRCWPAMHAAFQSTHPVWDATVVQIFQIHAQQGFNPRIPCGMRQLGDNLIDTILHVSIHASRVGCDSSGLSGLSGLSGFNPRIPCGMRRTFPSRQGRRRQVSIHASRVGCDVISLVFPVPVDRFQSTHPVWDATKCVTSDDGPSTVSIHASRVGCDMSPPFAAGGNACFNPRIPCGMRPEYRLKGWKFSGFQSTHPVWDATPNAEEFVPKMGVSIHASRVGCDGLEVNS